MSKIYEALQRAEQERLAGIKPPVEDEAVAAQRAAEAATPVTYGSAPEAAPVSVQPVVAAPVIAAPVTAAPIVAAAVAAAPVAAEPELDEAPISTPVVVATARGAVTRWTPQLERLPALEERGSAVEQFRSLRSKLMAYRDLNTLKSLMISSGLPKEGKSFIAANLAISFARHKASRVLLIDGDMRRSSLHEMLGCPASPGLSTYLAGKAELADVMQQTGERPDQPLMAGLESLTFIGGGDEGDMAGDLSGSPKFRELIETVSERFDWIIVDSSPVNLVTDGANLAHACDGVLLVARGGVTKFETAQRALGELKASRVLGVVLNAVEAPPVTEGYYGYDRYDSNRPGAGNSGQAAPGSASA